MIRVFPRRTNVTPTDCLAFIGDPPLFLPPQQPVRVSCTFTWDKDEALRLGKSWSRFYPDVQVGGPAFNDPGGEFTPGLFMKEGYTTTSRGCPRKCAFCLVPKREGKIRELPIKDGWIIQDNNLLACSPGHIRAVFDMLRLQKHPAQFPGGIDARLFKPRHADLLKSICLHSFFTACDSTEGLKPLSIMAALVSDVPLNKKRCYVLIGFNDDTIRKAEKRLQEVFALGFLPFAMLYESENKPKEWKQFHRIWCRPAIYKQITRKYQKEEG